ncbi:hypothetical protein EAG_09036 [Camponotus floridanus]|uniref:Uncharacterized protein n=1 Tax=Camponotus floridanus TaxID=104421 RepID=E2AH48_CAMFO|nr:hypothetical protein EAG_09036 [Camponotus floridanus]
MCKTHDLIKQYTEKVRETDRLKLDLEVIKKDANSMKSKYKSATDETRKLELQITEDKFKNEKLSNKIDEYEINIAADKQIIQQLTSKIKELEDECSAKIMEYDLQKSFYKGKIRDLEHELEQKPKVTHKRKDKKIISNNSDTVKLTEAKSNSDIGINVSLCDSELSMKSVQEKSIMTDEFYNIKDDPHPLFCAKCESRLPLALTPEKICKTMCSYPELIEKDFLSSNEILLSPRLIPNTYPDSTNRNEDVLSRALSTSSYLNLCSQYNDSTADNWKSRSTFHSMSATMQNCENDELRNADFTTHTRIATKPSRNNLGSISESSSSFQSMDCVRKDSYSNDLLAKHSSSIEEIKKQIGLLERQMKKFKRLKEKPNTNSCHCVMKYNDSALLNSNLFAIICKGIAEYYDKRTKTCSKTARDIYSEKGKKGKLKRHRLNKYNENKSTSLWKIENIDERYLQDKEKLYNKSEDTKKATTCDILQSKLCINKCNEISYVNESNKFLSDIDDCDKKKFIFCKENALNSAERTSIEDVLTMSHLSSPDKLYDNIEEISNNSFNEDNVKSINMDCQTKMEMKVSSCNSDISIDDADNRIADVILEENKIKRKNQNKATYNDRLFKKMRNLKRKAQANSHVNTEESIELYSEDYKPMKKLRIAHTPKTAVFQPSTDQDFTPCTIQSKSNSKASQQKNNRRLSTQILKDNLLTKNKENCTISKKCDEKNADEFSETNSIDDKRCTRKIYEKNLVSTNNENCLQNNNNLNLSIRDIKCASTVTEFDKHNDVSIEDTRKESISKERLTIEMSNNCHEFDVSHNNVPDNTAKDLKLEKIPLQTQVIIQSESGVHCKDSKYDVYKFTENLQIEATDITKKGISPSIELKYIYNTEVHNSIIQKTVKDKSDCGNHEASKNMNTNESISNQSIVMKATGHENHNNHDVPNEVPEIQYLQRDSEIIVENCTDDNGVDVSLKRVRNTLGEQEDVCANDKLTEIDTVEFQQENAQEICANQDKETKFIDHISYNNVKQFQTPMSQLTKYINTKCVNHKLSQKKTIYNCTITDKFVKKQLRRLANSTWENSVHYDVIQKLANTCGPRIIAKCIVEFLLEDVELDQTLDKSFTPPAPLMTTFEQKITALLVDLEVSKPTVSHFVQVAIEYKLFKLHAEMKTRVDSLTRMYLVLSRIQKDRGKVRIMCCNALYCMNLMSINVLYTVFTSWPEVLPNAEINKEILPTCIAFLIGSQRIHGTPSQKLLKRLLALKGLVLTFYKYAYTKQARDDIVKELITLLKTKRTNGLDTAIILVAKREGSSWTYTNILQSTLLPMIINYEHPCIYSAFSLLEDEGNIVLEISEQLCDLIQSGQGTHDQQEGIISALLSISRQKFDIVAPSIIKWTPSKPLRPTIITQLQAFINTRNRKFWKNYLQRI